MCKARRLNAAIVVTLAGHHPSVSLLFDFASWPPITPYSKLPEIRTVFRHLDGNSPVFRAGFGGCKLQTLKSSPDWYPFALDLVL